jgi:hypothetical protein
MSRNFIIIKVINMNNEKKTTNLTQFALFPLKTKEVQNPFIFEIKL